MSLFFRFSAVAVLSLGVACGATGGEDVERPAAEPELATPDPAQPAPEASPDAPTPSPEAPAAPEATPAEPAVRYVGRHDVGRAGGPRAAWPASRAIVRFDGTGLEATLTMTGGQAIYYDVIVDGVVAPAPIVLQVGSVAKTLASKLTAGVHTVELVKRTEGNLGDVQFAQFRFPGGGKLLPPLAAPKRRIEVVGDSAVTGYGIDGAGPNCAGGAPPQTHNARKSAPYLSAGDLGADLSFIGASDKGALVTASDNVGLRGLFDRALPLEPAAWSHASWAPDAWVLFPTNDVGTFTKEQLNNGYASFVERARQVYPKAHLFVVVDAMASDTYPVNAQTRTRLVAMATEVVRRRAAAGDTKVYAYTMTRYQDAQLTGCYSHPNVALSRQMANELDGWLRTRLGW